MGLLPVVSPSCRMCSLRVGRGELWGLVGVEGEGENGTGIEVSGHDQRRNGGFLYG